MLKGPEREFVANGCRAASPDAAEIARIAKHASGKPASAPPPLPAEFMLRVCTRDDVEAMAGIYREVFSTYPFPIHDSVWLLETMQRAISTTSASSTKVVSSRWPPRRWKHERLAQASGVKAGLFSVADSVPF
ncbi:MAG TPA: hypothetical protein DEB17_05860 [Chlorobaculum sp.]|uniref:Acetyltransferase, GNAT family n=1 Tax=Chlorobaculum tepidum (strain ATCC 49652 / DSM 12025 / NBRC 103806 / TLS) TaxID=194439 RepID=Q8KF46_CHLTE|nr:hypothetical protein [Chlorobaculum tepidum]AAM71728.1 hypothetical protein CT0486 [Chlorobaculum tepidum TLS]HBU23510.1 hypothetical protein [Chlorobaculum sp.]